MEVNSQMNEFLKGVDENDKEVIKWQLNSSDLNNIAGIVYKCVHGYPAVILLQPYDCDKKKEDKKINYMAVANPLWLTCPYLNRKIHDLESDGYIKKISSFLSDERSTMNTMKNAHAHYYYLRRKLYSRAFGQISSIDFSNKVLHSGIGGISDISNLKCLHQHYSHFLICSDNVAGRVVHNLLNGINYCRERLCDDARK